MQKKVEEQRLDCDVEKVTDLNEIMEYEMSD